MMQTDDFLLLVRNKEGDYLEKVSSDLSVELQPEYMEDVEHFIVLV